MPLLLENYLRELRDTHASGENVRETSFYPALANLLNGVGATLNPKVRFVAILRDRGAGLPDGGLFTAKQLKRLGGDDAVREPAAFKGQQPERGVVEVKSPKDDVRDIAGGEQVRRYLNAYGQVLVTNLREFLLVTKDGDGQPRLGESYQLAPAEQALWERAHQPHTFAAAHDAPFVEYLKRVMLAAAPLEDPKDLAWFLASYARDAKSRTEKADLPALQSVRAAMEQALELQFEGERGEAFFRSTLVQTLFYGIFSAWVLWAKSPAARHERFNWKLAQWSLHVPVIRTLFEQVVTPSNVRGLGVEEVLDWTSETLNRVRRDAFFTRFEEEHAVQYFYEPFLEAFDPDLRKQLGVWYTPEEIVRYMVERVDRVLRAELGIENGLADERVYVLDPCCGTGAYLVEVLRRIKRTIDEQGGDGLRANDLKRAARERVFGFEILPAPFVVAHLQLGLLLQKEGSPLADGERVGVYLTNALTGWEPPKEPKKQLAFEFHTLQEERDAAEEVKRDKPILVVLGNPPYNAFAGTSTKEEGDLVDAYKEGLIKQWGIKKFNLDDFYVRFFRLAERRIVEKTQEGVVCFISNFSYLSDPSFVVMRERFLREFDSLWFDSLNGDSRETGKLTPDGKPDPSVFSTEYNREGIRVGTAIGLLVRKRERDEAPTVRMRQFWGVTKREDLLHSLHVADLDAEYDVITPKRINRLSFKKRADATAYSEWPSVSELSEISPFKAFLEARRGALIEIEKTILEERMKKYYDKSISWEELKLVEPRLTQNAARFEANKAREKVLSKEQYTAGNLRRFTIRPYETRWCYISLIRPLWNEPRPDLWQQCWKGNRFVVTRMKTEKNTKGSPFYFSPNLVDYQALARNVSVIPYQLRASSSAKEKNQQQSFFADAEPATKANLSTRARAYLASLGVNDPDADFETAGLIWYHALAIGYSPAYLSENGDGIRSDFPRIPLPASREVLEESAALGRRVAALLDTEAPVSGVTSGSIRPELRGIANIWRVGGQQALDPQAGDLNLRAGWGHRGKGGVVMPGKGQLKPRPYTDAELDTLREYAQGQASTAEAVLAALGSETCDVYLNGVAAWVNVPARVWDYTIGGYQVIKKWLSYREADILGRGLTADEAREVTHMARRIAAILLLESALNASYERVKAQTYTWPAAAASA